MEEGGVQIRNPNKIPPQMHILRFRYRFTSSDFALRMNGIDLAQLLIITNKPPLASLRFQMEVEIGTPAGNNDTLTLSVLMGHMYPIRALQYSNRMGC